MFPSVLLRTAVLSTTILTLSSLASSTLMAQTVSLAVSSVSINIDPAATDNYTLQGSIDGLSLTGAAYVGLSVGNFGATIPLSSFIEQAGPNVITYQDTTGLAPNWVSSLTIDLNAHTFKAQANSIVLAGLTNPFAVKLGTDQTAGCTMVRVHQASPSSYQLTSADPEGMTCEISNTPITLPNVLAAGTATSVTVDVTAVQISGNDTPQNIQLFQADDNAQPTGAALCTLSQKQPGGDYACTVSFNESNPGMIPLLLQATVSGKQILSPGFALQVAATVTNDSVQQILNIQTAMVQAWQNFEQSGDSAYARKQSLMALRKLLAPPVALTGTPLGLSVDQESIYVRTSPGLPMVLPSAEVSELLSGSSSGQTTNAIGPNEPSTLAPGPIGPTAEPTPRPHGLFRENLTPRRDELTCNSPERDIVWNNKVMVWSPGDIFFEHNSYQEFVALFHDSNCPSFSVNNSEYLGYGATVASLSEFSNYGTIIINSHGSYYEQMPILVTGEPGPDTAMNFFAYLKVIGGVFPNGVACLEQGCFKFVYPSSIPATMNTIIYAGFCYSLEGAAFGFPTAFAPPGSNSAYYGYIGLAFDYQDGIYGGPLFTALVSQYENTGDAYHDANAGKGFASLMLSDQRPGPNIGGSDSRSAPSPHGLYFDRLPVDEHFGIWNNLNLGYIGNPKLTLTDQPPPSPGSQNLSAYMDGAASCGTNGAPYMNVKWVNRPKAGHLKWLTSLVSGVQDDFYDEASQTPPESTPGTLVSDFALAEWTPSALLPETGDGIIADFYPDMANPVAARACLMVHGVAGLFVQSQLAGIYSGTSLQLQPVAQMLSSSKSPGLKVASAYSVPLQDACGCSREGASASVTITPNGTGKWTVVVSAGAAGASAGQGPFLGEASIGLELINPGEEGQAQVTVSGTINDTPSCVTASNGITNCDFLDGQMQIGSQTISLYDYTGPASLAPVTLDTSADSAFIYVGMNANGEIGTADVFSVTLNIEFVNKSTSGGTPAVRAKAR